MLKTDILFGDNMVLCRNKPLDIWGKANPECDVEIQIQGKKACAKSDINGNWRMSVGPLEVSVEETMTVTSEDETLIYKNIQIGDVWLAGGQSNMEFLMRYDIDIKKEKSEASKYDIRFFDYPKITYKEQLDERDYSEHFGFWRRSNADNLEVYSAVGYYFAKEVKKKTGIPIGIVGCNWGGTCIRAWMSKEAIACAGAGRFLDDYENAVSELDLEAYETRFKSLPDSYRTTPYANPMIESLMFGATMDAFAAKLAEAGVDLAAGNIDAFLPQMGPKSEQRPCGLYESMLKSVAEYGYTGVLWYQGESDGDEKCQDYAALLRCMIEDWRGLIGWDIPFIIMQLPPFGTWMNNDGNNYVAIRRDQQIVADTTPKVYLSVISDGGEEFNIHPRNKSVAGHRMALVALNRVYGRDEECDPPRLFEAVMDKSILKLKFIHCFEGLRIDADSSLSELALWQGDKCIVPEICGISLSHNQISVELSGEYQEITDVSLGYSGWYEMHIINSANIPASPQKVALQQNPDKFCC